MKNFVFTLILLFTGAHLALSQIPPQAFNYSAVARDSSGQPIANTTIGLQVSLLKGSVNGPTVYSENHFPVTDQHGLFNLIIGAGAIQSGTMDSVGWHTDNFYLQVSMDASGGTNFLIMGTTQLLSVPYALYAKSAGTISGGSGGGGGGTQSGGHYIGEYFGGGIIYELWKDSSGVEHGYIIDLFNIDSAGFWCDFNPDSVIINGATSFYEGEANCQDIVNTPGHTTSAASKCLGSTSGGYTDWYLPAPEEILPLGYSVPRINRTLRTIPGAKTLEPGMFLWTSANKYYAHLGQVWNYASAYLVGYDLMQESPKDYPAYIRAIRKF